MVEGQGFYILPPFLPLLQEWLPSPSNMTWEDAKRILATTDFGDESELMKDLPPVEECMVRQLKDVVMEAEEMFENRSEMDACVRILHVLCTVIRAIPKDKRKKLKIQCQPTVNGHATFTNFLIVIKEDDHPKLLIETKKARISTDLSLKTEETAQVIRELHIIANCNPLPFLLTNAKLWSFGLGAKVGNKVSVTSTKHISLSDTQAHYILAQLLTKYLS